LAKNCRTPFDQPEVHNRHDTLHQTMHFTLPTVSVSSLTLLASAVNGVTIDWTANPEEKVLVPQCEDLTFALTGTHDIQNFNKKGRFKRCDFSSSTVMLGATSNEEVTMTGQDFLRRKKYYYGCDVNDHCNTINMKTLVEVIPTYTKTENQPCSGSLTPIKTFPLPSVEVCSSACDQKKDCMGFSFDPDEEKKCHLFDSVPTPSGQTKAGAACYAAQTECPPISTPHCSIDTEVTCTLNDDPTKECSEFAKTFPKEAPANAVGCEVMLKYDYKLTATTTETSTWTWATRTRKGDEPANFARPRVYSWLDEGGITDPTIEGASTAPLASSETVVVDFCKAGKYKTLAEAVVQSASNTICTSRDQYKLTVRGVDGVVCALDTITCPNGDILSRDPANDCQFPACPVNLVVGETDGSGQQGTGTGTSEAQNRDGCGFDDPIVGCVMAEDQAGLPMSWVGTTDCNDYVPVNENDCVKQVRYTYYVKHDNEPSGSVLINSLRYRDGSYWETHPEDNPHGNPRAYSEDKWGTTIATGGTNTFYELDTWEGENVDFCKASSVNTRFEFNTDGAGLNDCAKAGEYTLVTKDVAALPPPPTTSTPGPPNTDCSLEISLSCRIDDGEIPCEEYNSPADGDCSRTATYIHVLKNMVPFDSGKDLLLTSITRNRPGDVPHGDDFDFLDDLYNEVPQTLQAAFSMTIKESPTINFCTDDTTYVTTFNTVSTPDSGTTQCEDEVMYTLDLSS